MPTRSYFFPDKFDYLEKILLHYNSNVTGEILDFYRNRNIPPIENVEIFSTFLGINPKLILAICNHPKKYYRSFAILKKDKTERRIDTPKTYLKVIQWWILDNILNRIEISENVFGFVTGRSIKQNAAFHLGAKHILNVDIENFFPSITIKQVVCLYEKLGYKNDVANILAKLSCYKGCLPQGAPTSPAIANLVLCNLDKELSILAQNNNCKYSRYADDLTLSSTAPIDKKILKDLNTIVKAEGFNLKQEKTRFSSSGNCMEVTGIVINEKMQPSIKWRKKTRAILHKFKKADRLTRRDISYLYGIRGVALQFPDSPQLQKFIDNIKYILNEKLNTVIGKSLQPKLPNGLTLHEAQFLVKLNPLMTDIEIATNLSISKKDVNKILQQVFKKIYVKNRQDAIKWAKVNL